MLSVGKHDTHSAIIVVCLGLMLLVCGICPSETGAYPRRDYDLADPEKVAMDPNLAVRSMLQRADSLLEFRQFAQALRTATDALSATTDCDLRMQAEEIIIRSTYCAEGCDVAVGETEQLLSQMPDDLSSHAREKDFLNNRLARLRVELASYRESVARNRETMTKHPESARSVQAAYAIAKQSCSYGRTDEAVTALRRLIEECLKADEPLVPLTSDVMIAEAVSSLAELCLVREGSERAISELKDVAASHILDHAGECAYYAVGDVYRVQGNTESAEQAFLNATRVYSTGPIRYSALAALGDMYDDVARKHEIAGDREAAVEAWRKAADYYPDERRKCDTYGSIAWCCMRIGRYEEAAEYFVASVPSTVPESAEVRREVTFLQSFCYFNAGEYAKAKDGLAKTLEIATDPHVRTVAKSCLDTIEMREARDAVLRDSR